ncbi:unnamed protein product [Ceutorhynchus assimilis]|uniref:Vitellogenin domain-containing protein n=1 Tax=Ceutorhynchus assimilis TaxID=467358 RepID=A0A9N9N344_9CUCU|nr:unnamed protein product [Ceutorhynchus assimilis]
MSSRINLYLIYTTFCTLCSGFVLISSAAGSNFKFFPAGETSIYRWKSSVILNEIEANSREIGFLLEGQLNVNSLWQNEEWTLLKLEVVEPKIQPKSNIANSKLDLDKNPFIIVLKNGAIERFFLPKQDKIASKNLKRGIASLFQLNFEPGASETDASGHCNVSSHLIQRKTKSDCFYDDLESLKHSDEILGTKILSERINEYTYDDKIVKTITSKERHEIFIEAKQQLGSIIKSEQIIIHQGTITITKMNAATIEIALSEAAKDLTEASLITEADSKQNHKQFNKEVGLVREHLRNQHLGSIKSAKAFLDLLSIARTASKDDISKTLSSKKNKDVVLQLYDILGYAQTQNSHKAVMKTLHLDSEEHTDQIERYLWALSFSTHPNIEIVEDLLNKFKKYSQIPAKVRDTLILSLASLARTLASSQKHDYQTSKVLRNIEEAIINGLDYAKDIERFVYLNALKNLQSPSTIPKLMQILQSGSLKEEVLAWRALKAFGKKFWTTDLLKLAKKTLYQLDKAHDTSSRTLAADLLLESKPTETTLQDLLYFAASNETNFEIKQYVFQSVKMMADKYELFNSKLQNIIKNSKKLNNYSALAPRGLSTALRRSIFKGASVNGSLISVQEIKAGIVKRGVVDVVLDKNGISKELFTLGIFAGGLSSFTSSSSTTETEDEENSIAGMELTLMGTQIRPFVFFEGSGELMGHVWSGTASEITPAFQALILVQDHEDYLRLGNGFLVQINLKGAVSFDLSGKIEVSIWNRNAQSLIKKSVGYVTKGCIKVDTDFVKSQLEFEGSVEPKLNLEIDADFSDNVKLCMRLSQPDSIFRHSIAKLESIPTGKYEKKFALNRKMDLPGSTYALNRKNDLMCSEIFS